MAILGDVKVSITADLSPLERSLSQAKTSVTKTMDSLSAKKVSLNVNTSGATSALSSLSTKISGVYTKLKESHTLKLSLAKAKAGIDALSAKVEKMQGTLVTVGAAGALAMKSMISPAADFEKQMLIVRSKLQGITNEEFVALREEAKRLGASTKYSATQAGEGMQILSQAGFGAKEIYAALPDVLNLATAQNLTLAQSASVVADTMGQYGLAATESARITDVFSQAANLANTDVLQLQDGMKYLGPISGALGVSLEESVAVMDVFAKGGLRGGMAAQAFASSISRMAKPTKQMRAVMDQLGLSFFDNQGKFKGYAAIVKDLEGKMKGMTAEQRSQAITTLFGAEATKHWSILLKQGSGTLDGFVKDLQNSKGSTAKATKIMSQGFTHMATIMKSSWEGLMIALAESGAMSALTDMVQGIGNVFSWLSKLDPAILKFITTLVGVGTAVVAAVLVFSKLKLLFTAFMGPVGLIVVGLTVLATVLITYWDDIVAAWDAAVAWIKSVWAEWGDFLLATNPIGWLILAIQAIADNWDSIISAITNTWNTFVEFFLSSTPFGWMIVAGTAFVESFDSIVASVSDAWDGLVSLLSDAWDGFLTIIGWDIFVEGLSLAADASVSLWEDFTASMTAMWEEGIAAWGAISETLGPVIADGLDFISGLWDDAVNYISGIFSDAWDEMKSIAPELTESLVSAWDSVTEAVDKFIEYVKEAIGWLQDAYSSAKSLLGLSEEGSGAAAMMKSMEALKLGPKDFEDAHKRMRKSIKKTEDQTKRSAKRMNEWMGQVKGPDLSPRGTAGGTPGGRGRRGRAGESETVKLEKEQQKTIESIVDANKVIEGLLLKRRQQYQKESESRAKIALDSAKFEIDLIQKQSKEILKASENSLKLEKGLQKKYQDQIIEAQKKANDGKSKLEEDLRKKQEEERRKGIENLKKARDAITKDLSAIREELDKVGKQRVALLDPKYRQSTGGAYSISQEAYERQLNAATYGQEVLKARIIEAEKQQAAIDQTLAAAEATDKYANELATLTGKTKESNKHLETLGKNFKESMDGFGSDMGDALSDMIAKGGTWKNVFSSAIDSMTQRLLDFAISRPLEQLWGSVATGIGGAIGGPGVASESAHGNVFSGGRLMAFAGGGVVSAPTIFPMAGGAGLMGEAGPEGILPLERIGGDLGVNASGIGGVNVIIQNNSGVEATATESANSAGGKDINIMIGDAAAQSVFSGGSLAKAIEKTFKLNRGLTPRG